MTKKILVYTLLAVFVISAAAFGTTAKTMPIRKDRLIMGDEPLPPGPVYPYYPGTITNSPGVEVGTTHYDYQTNGSSGNRVALCNDGSKYVLWMNGLNYPSPRHVYFNWVDNQGNWYGEGGGQVNRDVGAGYCNLDIIYGNRAAAAYHSASAGNPPTYSTLAIDSDPPGFGVWAYYNPPDSLSGNRRTYWPYIAVDRNNRIHYVMTESTPAAGDPQRFVYTRSTNGGTTWSPNPPAFIDTVMVIGGVIDASPVSDKVVIAYPKTQDTSTQWYNDIVYILSNDGINWNFNDKVNVTNYNTDNDSLWAYTDCDVIFDYNDNIHIIWTAQWVTSEGIYYKTFLLHYNSGTQQIHQVCNPWPDSLWLGGGCDFGAWNRPMSKMNLGVYSDGSLNGIFATWTQFDTSDCSEGGYANGELYMAYTINGGQTWSAPVNLTNSHTPGCFAGECDSDHWSTLADKVTDSLRIIYINDKDAGGIPQTEGSNTENPVMYLAYRNPLLSSIENESARPTNFSLEQNYPNPFNARTVIAFQLKEASPVKLEVFDITGARVETLVDRELSAGSHQFIWNASKVASGVYYYKLTSGDVSETKQMVLMK